VYYYYRVDCQKVQPFNKKSMSKPFHTFSLTPVINADMFVNKIIQYRTFCEINSTKDVVLLCRQLEAAVDDQIAALRHDESSFYPTYDKEDKKATLNVCPTDIDMIMKMTKDAWKIELLNKLKCTLMKITGSNFLT
jgi:hypothetical protein